MKGVFMAPSMIIIFRGLQFSERGLPPIDEKGESYQGSSHSMQCDRTTFLPRNVGSSKQFHSEIVNSSTSSIQAPRNKAGIGHQTVKHVLTSETVLTHYKPSLPAKLSVDASPYGLGAVITHVYSNDNRRPIAYTSRTLNEHEKRYGQIDEEALAIMFGLKQFHLYLYG